MTLRLVSRAHMEPADIMANLLPLIAVSSESCGVLEVGGLLASSTFGREEEGVSNLRFVVLAPNLTFGVLGTRPSNLNSK